MNTFALAFCAPFAIFASWYALVRIDGRKNTINSYFAANNRLDGFFSKIVFAVCWTWANTLIIGPQKAYQDGYAPVIWFALLNTLALFVFAICNEGLQRKVGSRPRMPTDLVRERSGEGMLIVYSLGLLGVGVYAVVGQLVAAVVLLKYATGLNRELLIVAIACMMLLVANVRGMESSLAADKIKTIIIAIVFVVACALLVYAGTGDSAIHIYGVRASPYTLFDPELLQLFVLPLAFSWISGGAIDPQLYHRSASLAPNARNAPWSGIVPFGCIVLVLSSVGFLAPPLLMQGQNPELAGFIAVTAAIPWLGQVFVAMVAAALLATGAAALNAVSRVWAPEIVRLLRIPLSPITVSRNASATVMLLATALALSGVTLLQMVLFIGAFRGALFFHDTHLLYKAALRYEQCATRNGRSSNAYWTHSCILQQQLVRRINCSWNIRRRLSLRVDPCKQLLIVTKDQNVPGRTSMCGPFCATISLYRMLDFAQLQKLAVLATDNGTHFYRKLYGIAQQEPALAIQTLEQWQKLPVVTKDALIEMPLEERSFLPVQKLDHLRASSGTSGKPPLFSPRTPVRNLDYRLHYHDFKKPFMSFTVPLMPYWHENFQKEHGALPRVVVYDPKNPAISVRLAKAAGIDALSLFIYHVQTAGEEMKRQGVNEQIRFLEITGETCSMALYEYMRTTFPNATILQSYGASEVEDVHIGIPCKPLDGTEPLAVYHPKETHYLELLGPDGEVLTPTKGAEGDLLITAYPGEPSAFPLLRMRIGDTVRIVEEVCPHGSWSFMVVGRTDMDFVKVAGGVLKADEITRVLRLHSAEVTDTFTLHCYTKETPDGPKFEPILEVEAKPGGSLKTLAEKIATEIRVAPDFTYADGVAEKRYLPLACTQRDNTAQTKKHLRIVQHS